MKKSAIADTAGKPYRTELQGLRLRPLAAAVRWALTSAALAGMGAQAAELPVPQTVFATLGRADHVVNGANMTVKQHTDRAILNWQKFNVSKDASVRFDQPSAASIALNRIAQNDPSKILGSVSANGQIYLINQNGFIFGKDSRINANTLVASTLNISDDTFNRGITKVVDQDGRPALTGTGEVYLRDASGQYVLDASGQRQKIKIQVEEGASLAADKNGRVILAAPSVENRGEISAPDGQIIMVAASDKVYLQEAGSDAKLRGLVVEVGTGGDVSNIGKLVAERGNVSLMGFAVNQSGRASATTAVQVNGSVRLLAREGATTRREGDRWLLQPKQTTRQADLGDGLGREASVTLGSGSLTEATPDPKDQRTAVDSQTQDPSRIEVMGHTVLMQEGSTLRAPSGEVSITATQAPDQPGLPSANNSSRIYVEKGATIDVAGVRDVSLPMERNVAEIELRSNELRDSPLQRDGVLYAKTVKVDLRKGTPIADISGAEDRVGRSVAERSTQGGRLEMLSEGDAVLKQGSVVDFSGGSVAYRDGYINTTQLLSQGEVIDIGDADPNRLYDGILGDITQVYPRWNQVRKWKVIGLTEMGRFEKGYVEGRDAGVFDLRANAAVMDGDLRAQAINGLNQREPAQRAVGGELNVDLARTPNSVQSLIFQAQALIAELGPEDPSPANPDNAAQPAPLVLTGSRLRDAGVMKASLKTNGHVEIRSGTRVSVADGGSLSLQGGEVLVNGGIDVPNGKVSLTTKLSSTTRGQLSGEIKLAAGSAIDASGNWVNEHPGGRFDTVLGPAWIDGGDVNLSAQGNVAVEAGSRIDVSGGGRRRDSGLIQAGNAGSIALEAADINGSNLSADGELRGYALPGGQSGALSLTANAVSIGSGAPAPVEGDPLRPLVLAPEFFQRGGFSRYRIASNKNGVGVESGTAVNLVVENRRLDEAAAVNRPSGRSLEGFSDISLLPEFVRPAGELDLVLAQSAGQGPADAAVRVGAGATLRTDAGGKLGLSSDSSIFMDGTLDAPAGRIDLTVTPPAGTDLAFLDNQGIWLGSSARLTARGASAVFPDAKNQLGGEIKDGGNITLHADRGFVIAESGSVFDVSGTAGELDVATVDASGRFGSQRQRIASDAGRIELRAAEGIQMGSDLLGRSGGGSGASGGELVFEINPFTRAEPAELSAAQKPFPSVPSVIEVSAAPQLVSGREPGSSIAADQHGRALFDAGWQAEGGFASLKLKSPDRIDVQGSNDLSAARSVELDAPVLAFTPGEGGVEGQLSVNAAYVALGSTQVRENAEAPVAGSASLSVQAKQIDLVGAERLDGFGKVDLSSSGDIRLVGIRPSPQQRDFKGELTTAADLTLTADQVYPSTLSEYRVALTGSEGRLEVRPGDGGAKTVLAAGGKLRFEAASIVQNGTLRSPLGELNLVATKSLEMGAGSLTSNAASAPLTPFGRTQGGLDWIYPLGSQNLVYTAPPAKKLNLDAAEINIASGATVDTSGGGDLSAFEFIPGPGGSVDILDPNDPKYLDGSFSYQPKFAVLPSLRGGFAPLDPVETPSSGLRVGDSIHLAGGSGLAEGTYALLPAHYALLPGAFLVTPETGNTQAVPGMRELRGDGATIVAGYRTVAGTSIRDPLWSAFAVESNAQVKLQAEYSINRANGFFSQKAAEQEVDAPRLPRDAGEMRFLADTGLKLDGSILAAPAAKGLGGQLDIAAGQIAIVNRSDTPVAGAVSLVADDLNKLQVGSVLIGGVRSSADGVTQLETRADRVDVGAGVSLDGSELLLAAKDRVSVAGGARVAASGSQTQGADQEIRIEGDGALVRVSSGAQAAVTRSGAAGRRGSIEILPDATLAATGSMLLDASLDSKLQGRIDMDGGSLALGASRISLGTAPAASAGLVLTPDELASLTVDELILGSRSDISFYGDVNMDLGRLVLRGAGLLGQGSAGQVARVNAKTVRLENTAGVVSNNTGQGSGSLSLSAGQVDLGEGDFAIQGFSRATVAATGNIVGDGTGRFTVGSDLDLSSVAITGTRGADTTLDASGHSLVINAVPGSAADSGALGARLAISADRVTQGGNISLPAGSVSLTAKTGDVALGAGSSIDVSGRQVQFNDQVRVAPGGRIELTAEAGSVDLAAGAALNLQGDSAGSLKVSAEQAFRWAGQIDAKGSARGGSLTLDVGTLANNGDLSDWASRMTDAGFSESIDVRARGGDMAMPAGAVLSAKEISLSTDQGALRIAGSLDATGGRLALRSADELRLQDSARLASQPVAGSGRGGNMRLDATDADRDGQSGLVLESGARLDIAADGASAGQLDVRVDRSGSDVAITGNLNGALASASTVRVEAVRSYQDDGTISAADIAGWKSDTDAFMSGAEAIEGRLGTPGSLLAGVEVVSTGDLSLAESGWDLLDWRYGGRVGTLTLKAGGNLSLQQDLSDGFKAYDAQGIDLTGLQGGGQAMPVKDFLQAGPSWNLDLQAGGDVSIAESVSVRTGTGDISVVAGQDFRLESDTATLYTAGRPTDAARYGTLKNGFVAFEFYGEYPIDGGDVSIRAGRDVVGAKTGQLFDGWLLRTGTWSRNATHQGETPTAWAIALGEADVNGDGQPLQASVFRQNIGALGGGDIHVNAGRDVVDLSAVIPTSGKQTGEASNPANPSNLDYNTNVVEVAGGGSLYVDAGRDVLGGVFYTAKGSGRVRAGGAVGAGSGNSFGPVVGLGDARFSLEARQDVQLGAAFNPTVMFNNTSRSMFFTYSADSALSLASLAGNVRVQNDLNGMVDAANSLRPANDQIRFQGSSFDALSVYPASLDVAALQGDIAIERSLVMYPSAKGQLNLMAGQNIVTADTGVNVNVTQSDADPSLLPSTSFPVRSWEDATQRLQPFGDSNLVHAQTPVHRGDSQPVRIYAQQGSLQPVDPLLFVLPKFAQIQAGKDMQDVSFKIQHADEGISQITAGRDIRFTSPRNAQGNLVNLTREIEVAGPGEVQVFAGRTIDLGASEGLFTIGNTFNSALAERGADISIFAGQSSPPQFDAFTTLYLEDSDEYRDALTAFMRSKIGDSALNAEQSLAAFKALPEPQRRSFLLGVFFSELRASATAAAKQGPAGYQRGYDAIAALFPDSQPYAGDLKLFFSKVHTIDGGDINMLVPGGLINAGLAVAFSGQKAPSDLGIVAQREGAINAYLQGDFQVNQSRVFAMDGGDISIWSSEGDIDAGRGAKSAIAAPPPLITFDSQGNLKIEFPPVVSGSGIRTASSSEGVVPGDVFLAAPKGVVNAGEAGIGGNNVTIAATAVIGASNINVSGVSTGVPTATVSTPVVPVGAANAAAGAAQAAQQNSNTENNKNDVGQGMAKAGQLTPLNVEVVGFGDCTMSDIRAGKPGCG